MSRSRRPAAAGDTSASCPTRTPSKRSPRSSRRPTTLPLHGLALLAGGLGGRHAAVGVAPASDCTEVMHANVLPTWNVLRRFVGGMVDAGYGRIVTVGARHAVTPVKGNAAYAAAKGAVASMTATLAEDLRGTGVTRDVHPAEAHAGGGVGRRRVVRRRRRDDRVAAGRGRRDRRRRPAAGIRFVLGAGRLLLSLRLIDAQANGRST